MSLMFLRISAEELLAGKWTYQEYDGIGFTATAEDAEYLVVSHIEIKDLFTYQIQISRLVSQHKRKVEGLALVHEEDYYRIIEHVSLKQISDANKKIDITDTQKQLAAILQRAVGMGASDLHITRNDVLAQFEARVNGVLMPFMQIKSQLCDELVFVLYNVEATTRDTTWNRAIPQSANILYSLGGKPFRFRYAHFPIFGETPDCYHAVLRIIPSGLQKGNVGALEKIGISADEVSDLKKILSNPYGAYVIAGTTGSGKSTTLKNLMEWLQINRYEDRGCFLTVEDPVEYQIYGAKQSSVVDVEGGGFHAAIKSALRRDPDVLMVGEIRDNISANALAGAVESGHYCFTTVHAGNIVSLLQRMSALGIGSRYLHLNRHLVTKNQFVRKGNVIGLSGNTGRSNGPHLHLEISHNNQMVDPMKLVYEQRSSTVPGDKEPALAPAAVVPPPEPIDMTPTIAVIVGEGPDMQIGVRIGHKVEMYHLQEPIETEEGVWRIIKKYGKFKLSKVEAQNAKNAAK